MNQCKEIFANVHSIETFGAFDGPGIRYVLFLQGCPFQCQYCHNRDTWSTATNRLMTVSDVLSDYEKFKRFYKKGGITVSGGEPLLQINFLIELFKEAKSRKIHTCLDTSAATYHHKQQPLLEELLKYTDLVLLDIKHIDEEKHQTLTNNSNKQVLAFAKLLDQLHVNTIIRHVLVPTITADETDLKNLRLFIDTLHNVVDIDILPYHKAGIKKWDELGYKYTLNHIMEPSEAMVRKAEHILKDKYHFYKNQS